MRIPAPLSVIYVVPLTAENSYELPLALPGTSALINGFADFLEKGPAIESPDLHTSMVSDLEIVESFCFSDPGRVGPDVPRRLERDGFVSNRQQPIVQTNSRG